MQKNNRHYRYKPPSNQAQTAGLMTKQQAASPSMHDILVNLQYKTSTSSFTPLIEAASTAKLDTPGTLLPPTRLSGTDPNGSDVPPPLPVPRLVEALVEHLNLHIEHYHTAIWSAMDAQTRHNILDGIIYDSIVDTDANGNPRFDAGGYAIIKSYRTVAQVTENTLIGVVGNSWVLPLAKGVRLENYEVEEGETMLSVLKDGLEPLISRIAVPTPGVYAETYLSQCYACEEISENLAKNWDFFGVETPTAINPVSLQSRYEAPPNLQAKDMQSPIINIQNTPTAPDPTGMNAMAGILNNGSLFRDMTGVEGTQNIALQGMLGNQQAAVKYAEMASKLAALGQTEKLMKNIEKSGLPDDKKAELMQTLLGNAANFNGLGKNNTGNNDVFNGVVKGAQQLGKTPTKFTSYNPNTGESQHVEYAHDNAMQPFKIPAQVSHAGGAGMIDNPAILKYESMGYDVVDNGNGTMTVVPQSVDNTNDNEDRMAQSIQDSVIAYERIIQEFVNAISLNTPNGFFKFTQAQINDLLQFGQFNSVQDVITLLTNPTVITDLVLRGQLDPLTNLDTITQMNPPKPIFYARRSRPNVIDPATGRVAVLFDVNCPKTINVGFTRPNNGSLAYGVTNRFYISLDNIIVEPVLDIIAIEQRYKANPNQNPASGLFSNLKLDARIEASLGGGTPVSTNYFREVFYFTSIVLGHELCHWGNAAKGAHSVANWQTGLYENVIPPEARQLNQEGMPQILYTNFTPPFGTWEVADAGFRWENSAIGGRTDWNVNPVLLIYAAYRRHLLPDIGDTNALRAAVRPLFPQVPLL